MNFFDQQTIKSFLAKKRIWAKKSFGQHFLIDRSVVDDILKAADLATPDRNRTVLEIGPGLGGLTSELIKFAGKVLAVEADRELVALLPKLLGQPSNLTVVPAPIQHFRRDDYFQDLKYDLIANLPYNISSYVLRAFLEKKPRPKNIIVMVQKEVAERAIAPAGDSERGVLSVAVELFSQSAEIIRSVGQNSFWPRPAVESAILKIKPKTAISGEEEKILQIAKIGFAQRRKKISNSLTAGLPLDSDKIFAILKIGDLNPNLRPQDITLDQWKTISQKI